MQKLAEWFKQLICKHKFTREQTSVISPKDHKTILNYTIYRECKKCGYHESYLKYKN